MLDTSTWTSAFSSLGEEFCWHARNFAAMYGDNRVDAIHILLAAAEVSPAGLHGCTELTPLAISDALATMQMDEAADRMTQPLPTTLTPAAEELAAAVMGYASATARAPTLRDVWVALSQDECGLVHRVLECLGVDSRELYRRVSGT